MYCVVVSSSVLCIFKYYFRKWHALSYRQHSNIIIVYIRGVSAELVKIRPAGKIIITMVPIIRKTSPTCVHHNVILLGTGILYTAGVCECDAAAVWCPRLIFYYSTNVFYTRNLLIVSSYNLFKPPHVISSRVYYIILSLYTCISTCVCVYTFYLGTPLKGRWINPSSSCVFRNPPRVWHERRTTAATSISPVRGKTSLPAEQESTGSRCPDRLRTCAGCNKIVCLNTQTPRAPSVHGGPSEAPTTILYQ